MPGWDGHCLPSAQGEPLCPSPAAARVAVPCGVEEDEEEVLPFRDESRMILQSPLEKGPWGPGKAAAGSPEVPR